MSISNNISEDRQDLSGYEDDDFDYEDESTELVYLRTRDHKQKTTSSGNTSQRKESTEFISLEDFAKVQEDMAQLWNLVRTQSRFDALKMPL